MELVLLIAVLTFCAVMLVFFVQYQTRKCVTLQSRMYRDRYENVGRKPRSRQDEGVLLLPIAQ